MRYPNEKSVKFVIVIASSSLLLAQYMQWIRYEMIMEKLWAFSRESSRFLPENRDQQHVAFARAKEEKSDGRPLQQRSVSLAIRRPNFPFRHRSARIAPPRSEDGRRYRTERRPLRRRSQSAMVSFAFSPFIVLCGVASSCSRSAILRS